MTGMTTLGNGCTAGEMTTGGTEGRTGAALSVSRSE
jgi:hypothetical protein